MDRDIWTTGGTNPPSPCAADLETLLRFQAHMCRTAEERRIAEIGDERPQPRYYSTEELVLAHGVWCPHSKKPRSFTWMTPKMCYRNAAMTVIHRMDPELTYCEGYGVRAGLPIPFLHAWIMDKEGNAIDQTWRGEDEERAYIGIPFATDYLIRVLAETKRSGLLDRWEDGWPLQTGTTRVEDAMETRRWPNSSLVDPVRVKTGPS